jgi:hypothetical protein
MTKPSAAEQDAALRAKLPLPVKEQPDPFLQMTTGRMGAGGIAVVAFIIVAIVTVVFYGLNRPSSTIHAAASAPVSSPAAGGKVGATAPTSAQGGPHSHG